MRGLSHRLLSCFSPSLVAAGMPKVLLALAAILQAMYQEDVLSECVLLSICDAHNSHWHIHLARNNSYTAATVPQFCNGLQMPLLVEAIWLKLQQGLALSSCWTSSEKTKMRKMKAKKTIDNLTLTRFDRRLHNKNVHHIRASTPLYFEASLSHHSCPRRPT